MARFYHRSPEDALDIFYCDHYDFPLSPGHKFPLAKHRMVREELQNDSRLTLLAATPSTDRLGCLSLSPEGLRCRDQLVIGQAHALGVPLVITLGGGYSDPIQHTVSAHANTFRTAANIFHH